MNHKSKSTLAVLVFTLTFPMTLPADVVVSLVPDSTSVSVGDKILVSVVLTQDGSDSNGLAAPDLSQPLNSGFELTSFGVELSFAGSAFTPSGFSLANGFVDFVSLSSNTRITGSLLAGTGLTSPATIGTFELTAESPGTTLLTPIDPSGLNDFGFSNISDPLDTQIFSSFNSPVSISAVPEPSAFLAVGLIAMLGGARRYFRRQDI